SARLSHLSIVVFALIMVLAYMAYGFLGIGKLAAQFMPWDLADLLNLQVFLPETLRGDALDAAAQAQRAGLMANYNDRASGLVIVLLTAIYVVRGGMYSVVFTEVMQFLVMTAACIAIAYVAIANTTPEAIAAAVPEGWSNPFFGWSLDLD